MWYNNYIKQLERDMKPIGSILQHFTESGSDDKETFYDINDGYTASYNGSTALVIGVSHDGSALTIHLEEDGERPLKYSDLNNLDVFKLTKVA